MTRRSLIKRGGSLLALAGAVPAALAQSTDEAVHVPLTSIDRVEADGVTVFYRQAGRADAPVVLLLHGFPTSSFQDRKSVV